MSDSSSNLDLVIQSQSSKEVTINAGMDAASPATLFGRRQSTTSGLTWGYYGGVVFIGGARTLVANGTLTLAASTTNYVEVDQTGALSVNATGQTASKLLLYTIVTGASTVTSYTDNRSAIALAAFFFQYVAVAMADANQTLTQAQDLCSTVECTGALTAGRNLVTAVSRGRFVVFNNTTGGFAITVKTPSGTGVAVPAAGRYMLEIDGTNVNLIGSAGGSFTGGTLTSALNEAPPVTIASAATVAIGAAAANSITISGTTTITAFDTIAAGAIRRVNFSGVLTLTHNATSLILPGAATITTAAGDVAEFMSLGAGNWRCDYYSRANGTPVVAGSTSADEPVNAQTGTSYTYVTGDKGKLVTHNNAGAIAGTLPQAGASFPSGWWMDVQNRGAGTLTITPTTSTVDGASTLALTTGQGCRIASDGTNYFTQRGIGGGSTFTGGTLTSALNEAPQVTLASAATVNIGAAAANSISVTGTTTITAFDTIASGAVRRIVFAAALTLTHNATSLILPGAANITTAAGDVAWMESLGGGNWRCVGYNKASGAAVVSSGGGLTNWTDAINTASPNATVPVASLTATGSATNITATLVPKGSGGLSAHVPITGWAKIGAYSVDWQQIRDDNTLQSATGAKAVITGGDSNKASGDNTFIGGGYNNIASAQYCFVGCGTANTAGTNTGAVVVGGSANSASGQYAFIGAGNGNAASGTRSVVVGGITNSADGDYSCIPGGRNATTRGIYGMWAWASGQFGQQGDAQVGRYLLKLGTTDATPSVLTTDRGTATAINTIALPNFASYAFRGRIIARRPSNNDMSDWEVKGTIKKNGSAASAALVGTATITMLNQDSGASAWAVAITADTTLGALKIQVTGVAATTISWLADIETVELTN